MKSLPKSLHTVTVLVRVARKYMECENYPAEGALNRALVDLGYPDSETLDPYGLVDKALEQLEAQ